MYEDITTEQYYKALDRKEEIRKELLEIKLNIEYTSNSEKRKELRNKVFELKKELSKCLLIMSIYKNERRGIKK